MMKLLDILGDMLALAVLAAFTALLAAVVALIIRTALSAVVPEWALFLGACAIASAMLIAPRGGAA